jgi:hypothetical protein
MSEELQCHLDRLATTQLAESEIHKVFFLEARSYADSLLTSALKTVVGPSALANAAIRSAIKCAKAADLPFDATHFRALLFSITLKKSQTIARRATAKKRDVQRNVLFDENRDSGVPDATLPEIVAAQELAQQITLWILSEADGTRRIIRYLGIIEEESGKQIHSILENLQGQYPEMKFQLPAVRTIQQEIADARDQIRQRFGNEME